MAKLAPRRPFFLLPRMPGSPTSSPLCHVRPRARRKAATRRKLPRAGAPRLRSLLGGSSRPPPGPPHLLTPSAAIRATGHPFFPRTIPSSSSSISPLLPPKATTAANLTAASPTVDAGPIPRTGSIHPMFRTPSDRRRRPLLPARRRHRAPACAAGSPWPLSHSVKSLVSVHLPHLCFRACPIPSPSSQSKAPHSHPTAGRPTLLPAHLFTITGHATSPLASPLLRGSILPASPATPRWSSRR